ncbi:MAG: alpha/beta hydrolase, partial [Pseudobutyrivibrio ruminis]|nr:alpha/beta hydrolase [Pseudobutyrivibrio ruminis]
ETSANQAIALTEYFLAHYNIDSSKVYLHGYSGGGETGSLVMEKRPDLFTAFLCCATQWDGEMNNLVRVKTPVYMVVGESDSYYGSKPLKDAYAKLYDLYKVEGYSEKEIEKFLVLDIKTQKYFTDRGFTDQHAGGQTFAKDKDIMGWLFGEH